jgi:hypothetical protein
MSEAVGRANRYLSLRSGKACVDQHQPYPRLLRRLGARVDEVEHPIQLAKALDVGMAQRQLLHVADLEVGGSGQ